MSEVEIEFDFGVTVLFELMPMMPLLGDVPGLILIVDVT